MIKSIQVILNCLNELRVCYCMERSSLVPSMHEVSKVNIICVPYFVFMIFHPFCL